MARRLNKDDSGQLQVAGEGVNASVMPLSALCNGVGSWEERKEERTVKEHH